MKFSLKNHFGNILFLAIIIILIAKFAFPGGMPSPISVIESGSMRPTLERGDVIFWTPSSIDNIHIGDIVVYKSSMGNKYIVHRVIEIKTINGERALITKGDANEYPDQYGPHAVENYVTSKNLVGKVVMLGNLPVKLPYIGLLYIYSRGFLVNIAGYNSLPLGIGAMFFGLIFMSKEEKMDKKILLIIRNFNKISFLRLFFITFIIFIIITASTLLFAYDKLNVSLGVGEKVSGGDINVNLHEGKNATRSFWVIPHAFSPMKIVIFKEGSDNINPEKKIDYLNPGEMKNERIIMEGYKNGTYNAKISVFTSPFWILIPDSVIYYFYDYNPFLAAFILDVISALIISVLVSLFVLFISLIVDLVYKHREKKELEKFIQRDLLGIPIIKKKKRKIIPEIEVSSELIYFSILSSLISLPVALFFQLFVGIILTSIISSLFVYLSDHKIKNELVFTSLYSSIILILLYTFINVFIVGNMGLQILLYAIGISLIIYIIFIIPIVIVSLLTGYILFKYEEKNRPEIILESDF